MPGLKPIAWREFVRRFRQLGFEGPLSGGKHPFMIRGDVVCTIPNPHGGDIGVSLLSRILKQAGVSRKEWTTVA